MKKWMPPNWTRGGDGLMSPLDHHSIQHGFLADLFGKEKKFCQK
jgi:hypothetical protein